jgi:hypothetical protein
MLPAIAMVAALLSAAGPEQPRQVPQRGSVIDGLPLYPGATPKPELRGGEAGMRTVSIENASVRELSAGGYISNDPPEKVLNYYRDRLKFYGAVIECGGGRNTEVSIRLSTRALANPEACDPDDVGARQTELKAPDARGQHLVAVGVREGGSEFTLVYVRTH